jgi:hypothetical protein
MSYIPDLKNLKWIDLSENHQKIRRKVENYIATSCCSRSSEANPLMIKGAFGVGKTNTLSYAFTYAWTELGVPAFFIDLNSIIEIIEAKRKDLNLPLITGNHLINILEEEVETLRNQLDSHDWSQINGFSNNSTDTEPLNNFLKDVSALQIAELNDGILTEKELPPFTEDKIKRAAKSKNKALIIIDEFEDKYWKLKQRMEYAGGGPLRVLFEYVIKPDSKFYLIIGNGPASGYEVGSEDNEQSGSETAQNRRLEVLNVPFPRPTMLATSFLAKEPIGYINFIWWLSRSRPGLIQKAKDELGSQAELLRNDYVTIIKEKSLFTQSVDSQSDTVKYLNEKFFEENIPPIITNTIFKNILFNNSPIKITVADYSVHFSKCKEAFLGSKKLTSREEILSFIENDLNSNDIGSKVSLKHFQSQHKFIKAEWKIIAYYLNNILESISDENGKIAFGVLDNNKWQELFASAFLKPLLQLVYDFIIQFEDSNDISIQQSCDYLLEVIKLVDNAVQESKLDIYFPGVIYRDKDEDSRNFSTINISNFQDELNIQLSPLCVREVFEQPIGDPKLNYKNERLDVAVEKLSEVNVLIKHFDSKERVEIIFIPDLPDSLLISYVTKLKSYLQQNFYKKYWKDGKLALRIIYFKEKEEVNALKDFLAFDSEKNEETIWKLNKINVRNLDEYNIQFPRLMIDFVDSLCKIAIVAQSEKELVDCKDIEDDNFYCLDRIKDLILDPQWSERKEVRRTIEHFSKLFFNIDKSAISTIVTSALDEYNKALEISIPQKRDFHGKLYDLGINTSLIEAGREVSNFTKRTLFLLLLEKPIPPEELLNLLRSCENFRFYPPVLERGMQFDPYELSLFFKNSKAFLEKHKNFDTYSPFISGLSTLYESLIQEDKDPKNIADCYEFLGQEKYFISSYHEKLGGSTDSKIFSETLYCLKYFDVVSIDEQRNNLSAVLKELQENLSTGNTILTETTEQFKEIFTTEINFDYAGDAGKVISKIISPLLKLLEENASYSILIVASKLIYFIERVIKNVNAMNNDLERIIKTVETSKNQIQLIQDKINKLYGDSFNEVVFTIHGETHSDYATNFISKSIKQKNEYKELFSEDKKYSPFGNYELDQAELKKLFIAITESLKTQKSGAEERLNQLNEIAEEIKEIVDLEQKIEELLNTNANAEVV